MKLEGSCHCGNVRFSCEAYAPVPFLHCYCSICRKTAGVPDESLEGWHRRHGLLDNRGHV